MRRFALIFGLLLFGCGLADDRDEREPQRPEPEKTTDEGKASAQEEALSEPYGNGETEQATGLVPPPADEALDRIPDLGRKLLALRSYLRAGSCLEERWSWTEQEIQAFQGSAAQSRLLDEVAAVKAHFARRNPGYEIYANTSVRSLDVQIARWNESPSVGSAAREVLAAWKQAFGDNARLDGVGPNELRGWLLGLTPTRRPNIAAPGLTLHGRAQAIDFQISWGGKIVGGADDASIENFWRAGKWDRKLKASIDAAGPSFDGPLTSPDEPWHYDYAPPGAVARSC